MLEGVVAAGIAAAAMIGTSGPAAAYLRHHHAPPRAATPAPQPSTHAFYPEEVEGGVKGNLSFNNQLRKLSDPLNANGGR